MINVVACIDGSNSAKSVCDAASWASLRVAAPLKLLHVLDKAGYPTHSNLSGNIGLGTREHLLTELIELDAKRGKLALEQGRHLLDDAQRRAIADGVGQVSTMQRHGSLVETLTEIEPDLRLLVMGQHGEAHEDQTHAVGTQLESVIRTLQRPVLVVQPDFKIPHCFMIAFDGSATAKKALDMVKGSTLLQALPCHMVMISEGEDSLAIEFENACHTLETTGFEVTRQLLAGEVITELVKYQVDHDIDLMVMGAYGHSRIRQFLVGSNTTKMLSASTVSLLLLR